MPKSIKVNGSLVPNEIIEYTWLTLPIDIKHPISGANSTECLVNPLVADYIEALETEIKNLQSYKSMYLKQIITK